MLRKVALPVLLLSVLLSGCLTNPNTGRIGPSWETTYRIPLISQETSLDELAKIDDLQTDPQTGVYRFGVSHETHFNLEPIYLDLDPIVLTYPGSGIPISDMNLDSMIIPVLGGTYPYSNTLDIPDFTSLTLESGSLEIRIPNNTDLTSVHVSLLDEMGNLLGEASATDPQLLTINLAGKTLTQKIQFDLELTSSNHVPDGIEVSLVLTGVRITQATHLNQVNTDFEFSGSLSDLPLDSIQFSQGSVSLDLLGLGGLTLQVNQFNLGGASATGPTLDLTGLRVTPQTPLLVKGRLTGSNVTLDVADIKAMAHFYGVYVTEADGKLDPTEIDLPVEVIGLDLSLLNDLPKVEMANMTLTLRIRNQTGIPLDFSQVRFSAQTPQGQMDLATSTPMLVPGLGWQVVQITPENSNILDLINSSPTAIEFGGKVLAGSDGPIQVNLTKGILVEFDLDLKAEFILPPAGVSYRLEPLVIDPSEADLEILERQAKEVRLLAEVTNSLPIGALVTIVFSSNPDPWSDLDSLRLSTEIMSGVTDANGNVTAPKKGLIQLNLTGVELARVLRGGFAGVELQIRADDPHRVVLRAQDHIKIDAWAELTAQVNR